MSGADREGRTVSQQPGPLDKVKLELAVVLGLVVGVLVVVLRLELGQWTELAVLAAVGFGCGGWLAARTRGVLRRHEQRRE